MSRANVEHFHKCWLCGRMWSHFQRDDVNQEEYHKLHNCPDPECLGNQRWIHHYADEVEEYPGQWDKEQLEKDAIEPGGSAGGLKKQSEKDKEYELIASFLSLVLTRGVI